MPDIGELIGQLVGVIGQVLGASSLRLGIGPTLAIAAILLVLLSLVARPASRWLTRDLGHLTAAGRSMALAAESGGIASFSLGTAGIARSAAAASRLQTLAALPILSHVARAAARSGVPIEVTVNDPVAAMLAESTVLDAHRRTETLERANRARTLYVGEGRATAAAHALASEPRPGAAFVMGGLAEEGLLLLDGFARGARSTTFGSAAASQATSVLLEGEGTLIGPELYQAPSDLLRSGHDRIAVFAGNRIAWASLAVLVVGSLLVVFGGVDIVTFLVGH
jgi:hypothetical protein